ncbi:DUF2800 domain-containing protein [Clostridium sp. WILCCON 0269]|uniref:DUF2800 domain-containing protein n=1 Tax=Candidatus Clostridium eludens TaxID=3381663 RepID=A0ABW8SMS8_9CLOT
MSVSEKHAILSPSSSHRWLKCTPSARLEETLPEKTSEYAAAGTLAHKIAELKLKKYCIEPMSTRTFNSRLNKLKKQPLYEDEMMKRTDTYLDYVAGILHGFDAPPYAAVEKKIDYSTYAPEGFGTCDCLIIGGNIMHVIDFKYGKGVPVSAEKNTQMMFYALGAFTEYAFLYPIKSIIMTIVQPRQGGISEYQMPSQELLNWGESIKPIAQKAFNGEGEFIAGAHCRFCKAAATCRTNKDTNMAVDVFGYKEPPLISNEEVGQILEKAQNLAKWVKRLEEYALSEVLKGNDIPGWKAVHGKSVRQFTDQDKAFEILKENGMDEIMLYERKPITLAAAEDLLGKSKFKELLDSYVNKSSGKPTLVPLNDKREPIQKISAKDVFKNEGGIVND